MAVPILPTSTTTATAMLGNGYQILQDQPAVAIPQIQIALADLQSVEDRIANLIVRLRERIEPVLRPELNQASEGFVRTPECSLANQIHNFTDALQVSASQLADMLERIEL